jgi:3-oxoacyl-[acyl-carrier protein] reductase
LNLRLENRVALVTAGSLGLGFATALQLAREGAQVALCSRDEAHVSAATDAIEAETGHPALGIAADITRPDDIERLFGRVADEYGGLDVLVANTGAPPAGSFADLPDEVWQAAFDQNVLNVVRVVRAALPLLRLSDVPAVLAIGSFAVRQPVPGMLLSSSVRLALIGLTRTLASDLGREGIRFNCIVPGWMETVRVQDMIEARVLRDGSTAEEEIARLALGTALRRLGTPEEFAAVATFLCSPRASYVTGAVVPVDGGMYPGML